MASQNKKSKEIQKKQEHKLRLLAAKKRKRSQVVLDRPEATLLEKPTILIVCEGKNTEPSYFNQFKLTSAQIESFGDGKNTLTLVDSAIRYAEQSDKEYEQKWVVFDKDDFPDDNFDNAIHKATANGFNVAYSNQAFEYWLILHFENHNGGAMSRHDYCDRLNNHLKEFNHRYDCDTKMVDSKLFDILLSYYEDRSRIDLAIERAKRVESFHEGDIPSKAESITLVYKLVEELIKYK